MSKNGFIMKYSFVPKPIKFVWYRGELLKNLVKQPTPCVNEKEPLKSEFRYDNCVIELSDSVFDTIEMLYAEGEHCLAVMLASDFYESFMKSDEEFRAS